VSSQSAATTDGERRATKWLTFYTYYLFAGAILLVSKAALMMTEGEGLGGFLGLGPFAIFMAAVGFGLLWREAWGWKANWVLLFLPLTIIAPLTIVAVALALTGKVLFGLTSKEALLTLYISLALNVAWAWPNYVYFRKRRYLFR